MVYLKLIAAAKKGDWKAVESLLSKIAKEPEFVIWAYMRGRINPDGNIRDLAATTIEIALISEKNFDRMRNDLAIQMGNDENPFVGYRLAFALANHGPGAYKKDVIEKLHEAEKDKDVGEIAKRYLEKMQT